MLWSSVLTRRGMCYLVAGNADAFAGDLFQPLCVKVSEGELT